MEKPLDESIVVVAELRSRVPVEVRSISPEPEVSCIWLFPVEVLKVMVPLLVVNAIVAVPDVSRVMLPEESISKVDVSISKGTSVVVPRDIDVEPSMCIVVESISSAPVSRSNKEA